MRDGPKGRGRKLALGLAGAGAVSVLLLGYLLYRAHGIDGTLTLARNASWSWLALSIFVYLISTTVRTWRWNLLLPAATTSFPRLYAITSVHTMINSLLPARLGELAFPILMRSHASTPTPRSVTMFLVARVLDVAVLAFLFVVSSFLHFGAQSPAAALGSVAAALAAGLVALIRAGPLYSWTLRQWERSFPRRPSILALGRSLEADLIAMTSSRKLLAAGTVTLAMVLTRHVFYWATMRAIGFPLAFPAVIIGATFGEATYLLPIHGVAGLGTVEAGWTVGMGLIGMDLPNAVASGLFVHIWALALSAGFGCLSLPLLWKLTLYSRHSDP